MAHKTALEIEDALLDGRDWCGMHFDYKKCYDQIPWELVDLLSEKMGMSERISGPMQRMVRQLERRFKSGQGLGEKWRSTNGLLQGCPLAVVALNMVVHVWARTMREELP